MHTAEALNALNQVGFLGAWHIDYTNNRFRGSSGLARLYGVKRERMIAGLPLSIIDRCYPPDQLEATRKNRSLTYEKNTQHVRDCKIISAISKRVIHVQCSGKFETDPYGALREARGVLFVIDTPKLEQNDKRLIAEDALRSLKDAYVALERLSYSDFKPLIQIMYKQVARDANRAELGKL